MAFRLHVATRRLLPFSTFIILVLSVLTLTTCSSDDPAQPPITNTGTIGPAGGTVTDAGGASVIIPPGALTEEVKITVNSFQDPETCPYPTGPVPIFWGAAQFGPAGTQFNLPVKIVMSTRQRMNPGDEYQLFVYDTENQVWEITKDSATVTPDGQTLVAEISHFSVFSGSGFAAGSAARSQITQMLCQFGSPMAVCQAYADYFQEYVADVGDKGAYDDQCKEVVGLDLQITCDINGDTKYLSVREGVLEGEDFSLSDPDNCGEGSGNSAMLEVWATIYFRCTLPELEAEAEPAEIELGGSSTVTATLMCGQMVFPGQPLDFESEGVGLISPVAATTNAAGQATTTYTNDEAEGQVTVTAYYDGCDGQIAEGTQFDEAVITTAGGWTGTLTIDYDHPIGSSPLDNFSDLVTINFDFEINEQGGISGSGSGTHGVNVTAGGECWTSSVDAPAFMVAIYGAATEQTLNLAVVPNPMMPVSFVITCPQNDGTVDYPYPLAEGLIEGEILTLDITIAVARTDGATVSGSGSRGDGTDLPMDFDWTVVVNKAE